MEFSGVAVIPTVKWRLLSTGICPSSQ